MRKIAAKSDVMIENYAPGVLDKLGIGAREMVGIKPDLVCVGMGAFGAKGPWRSFRAYGSTVEQASGLPFANGEPNDPPTMQHVAYGDPIAGIYGSIAALTALYGRNKNGGGAIIDLGQVECLVPARRRCHRRAVGAERAVAARRQPPSAQCVARGVAEQCRQALVCGRG